MNAEIIRITKTYRNGDTFTYTFGQLDSTTRTPDNYQRSWKGEKDPFAFTLQEFEENTGREWFPVVIKSFTESFVAVESDENPQVDQARTVYTLEAMD